MPDTQTCAAWDCKKSATHDKPLCYEHWLLWDSRDLEECDRCHWFYGRGDIILNEYSEWVVRATKLFRKPEAFLCTRCTLQILEGAGELTRLLERLLKDWPENVPESYRQELLQKLAQERAQKVSPPPPRKELKRGTNYVYILKTDDSLFYVGQTSNLAVRYQEHKDGTQAQTRGKNPRLVYIEAFEGDRDATIKRETELSWLNQTERGQRQLRKLIEEFRIPLRLVDLNA